MCIALFSWLLCGCRFR